MIFERHLQSGKKKMKQKTSFTRILLPLFPHGIHKINEFRYRYAKFAANFF